MKKPKIELILKRIERIRKQNKLDKSAFAKSISMTPQCYNNYFGKQKSKPSLHLIFGVCAKYDINANWLLGL